MHEASLVQGLLDMVLKALADYNAGSPAKRAVAIKEIVCGAGLLGGFEEQTLRACYEIFAEGTPAENAALVIRPIPLACACRACGQKFELVKRRFVCPACGSEEIDFSGGNGLVLLAINVESEENDNG